jgi:sporulation protein YlmC with PRC-barrel domain
MSDDPELEAVEAQVIQPGWEVYSSDGERVGTVGDVERGHFELALEVLPGSALEVPFDDVEAADGGRVELDVPADAIALMGWPMSGEPPQ